MALIVAVHGVGQQFKGDAIIHREWWPALLSGLHLAGKDLSDPKQLSCPFYGHIFRERDSLAMSDSYRAEDVGEQEAALLQLLWQAAAAVEPKSVPPPGDHSQDLGHTPEIVQRALNAVAKSSFLIDLTQATLIGDLKQVVWYLNDADTREKVLGIVTEKIAADTKVVIGHSLGSVVAYEALCRKGESVVSFLTLGSPLGIPHLIFDKLRPPPDAMRIGAWPRPVKHWTNIADRGDIVALEKKLAPFFGNEVHDVLVNNGSEAHHGDRYLSSREAGEAVAGGIW